MPTKVKTATTKQYKFRAAIYKTGINFAVDVPASITKKLTAVKGYIRVKGTVNNFPFTKSLVPVKDNPYRLFVNMITLKGANTTVGKPATFIIEQDEQPVSEQYPMHDELKQALAKAKLQTSFDALTESRKKDILRYILFVKTQETRQKNIQKVITQLKDKQKNVRIP